MLHITCAVSFGLDLAANFTSTADADDAAPPIQTLLADPGQLAVWLGDHDPQVEAAYAKIEAAQAAGAQARVLPNPQLSAGVGGILISGNVQPGGFANTYNFDVGVSELIELGKRGPRREGADLRTREAGESRVATLGSEVSTAMTALGALAYAVARHDVVSKNLDASKKLEASEKNRVDKGDLSPLEFKRIELDTHELEVQLQRAEADVSAALSTCSATLFAPCSTTGLDASSLDAAAPVPAALPDAPSSVEQRPSHVAQHLEADALGQDALLADHRKIPDPTIGAVYELDNFSGDLPQTLAFTIGIPLPVFDRGTHDAAAARANAHAIEAQDRAQVRNERGQVEALTQKLNLLRATLDRLQTELVPSSQQVVDKTKQSFDIGESAFADLMLAERAHRDLLLEVLDTRNDLFTVRAQLRQALGLDDAAARTVPAARGGAR